MYFYSVEILRTPCSISHRSSYKTLFYELLIILSFTRHKFSKSYIYCIVLCIVKNMDYFWGSRNEANPFRPYITLTLCYAWMEMVNLLCNLRWRSAVNVQTINHYSLYYEYFFYTHITSSFWKHNIVCMCARESVWKRERVRERKHAVENERSRNIVRRFQERYKFIGYKF